MNLDLGSLWRPFWVKILACLLLVICFLCKHWWMVQLCLHLMPGSYFPVFLVYWKVIFWIYRKFENWFALVSELHFWLYGLNIRVMNLQYVLGQWIGCVLPFIEELFDSLLRTSNRRRWILMQWTLNMQEIGFLHTALPDVKPPKTAFSAWIWRRCPRRFLQPGDPDELREETTMTSSSQTRATPPVRAPRVQPPSTVTTSSHWAPLVEFTNATPPVRTPPVKPPTSSPSQTTKSPKGHEIRKGFHSRRAPLGTPGSSQKKIYWNIL